jgi:N-acetylmuramoyl-L-alanine amidase
MEVFERETASAFKQKILSSLDEQALQNIDIDALIASGKEMGITSAGGVTQLARLVSKNPGGSDVNSLPKPALNILLAYDTAPAEKLNQLQAWSKENESKPQTAAAPGPRHRHDPLPASYRANEGDCIASIAYDFGFFTETIWNHPNNKTLNNQRKDLHVLNPGDVLYVPARRLGMETGATDQKHRFRLNGVPLLLRIQLQYFEKPWPGIDYTIYFADQEQPGTTDGQGWLQQYIPPNLETCLLKLADGSTYELALGYVDPIDVVRGAQRRLTALGYYYGESDGQINDDTRQALRNLQFNHGLDVSGEIDDNTKNLLVRLTGA